MLLFGDGSPTRHLSLLTGQPVTVALVGMAPAPDTSPEAPQAVAELAAPLTRREVWLTCADGTRLAHAVSWWPGALAERHLRDRTQPIWSSLAANRTELYRDMRAVSLGYEASLAQAFGTALPLWRRDYLFWRDGRPLTLIVETFSPGLERWIGPDRRLPGLPTDCAACLARRDGLPG
jgi:chorismate lyase